MIARNRHKMALTFGPCSSPQLEKNASLSLWCREINQKSSSASIDSPSRKSLRAFCSVSPSIWRTAGRVSRPNELQWPVWRSLMLFSCCNWVTREDHRKKKGKKKKRMVWRFNPRALSRDDTSACFTFSSSTLILISATHLWTFEDPVVPETLTSSVLYLNLVHVKEHLHWIKTLEVKVLAFIWLKTASVIFPATKVSSLVVTLRWVYTIPLHDIAWS